MTIHAFVGPSLPKSLRKHYSHKGVNFHPPLGQADLIDHVEWFQKNDIILVADGFYKDLPSTWHKEILYAIKKGFKVVGCSSIGALRATECEDYGMLGFGSIYQWFKEGLLYDDSDVALLHDAETYEQLTIPICDILATLKALRLSKGEIIYCCNILRQIHFESRTESLITDHILTTAERLDLNSRHEICNQLRNSLVRQKHLDTQQTLERLLINTSSIPDTAKEAHDRLSAESVAEKQESDSFEFNKTVFFDGLKYLDRSIHSKKASLLSTRSSLLSAAVICNSESMKALETEAMLIKVSALLFDQLSVDVDSDRLEKFKSDYMKYIEDNGWSKEMQESSGLTDDEITEYLSERFKSTLLLGNIHRFDPYSSACKSFFAHLLLNPEFQNMYHSFEILLDSMSRFSVDPISEASESNLPTWSDSIVSQILASYAKGKQNEENFGIGSFLDFDTTAAMQRVIKNFRRELLRYSATKSLNK